MIEEPGSRIDEALETLKTSQPASARPWMKAAEVRHEANKRHRRKLEASGFAAVLIVVVAVIATTSISTSHAPTNAFAPVNPGTRIGSAYELTSDVSRLVPAGGAETDVANAEQTFSIQLLQHLVANGSDSNQLVSPLSLAEALAMTQLGARGQTADQIANALDVSGLSASRLAQGWASLDQDLVQAAARDHVALADANSIWTKAGFPVESSFLNELQSEFGAGVWQTNFQKDPSGSVKAINSWVSKITKGHIPTLLSPSDLDSSTVAILLNAVLFEAQWQTQLTSISHGTFEANGSSVPVTFLSPDGGSTSLSASADSSLDAVELPYWNGTDTNGDRPAGRYAALLLMPTQGSLSQFVSGLDASKLADIVNGLSSQQVTLSVPQTSIGSNLQLKPTLEAMGITKAFDESGADFSGFSHMSTFVGEVKQKATLQVTKWGTIASAATAVTMEASSTEASQITMTFNRPFLFLVRDTKTGAILFESAIDNPTSGN